MALVMLPCDLPWWPSVVKLLERIGTVRDTQDLLSLMQKLHDMCNISLDPEEDTRDDELFGELGRYLEELPVEERRHILRETVPSMVEKAKALKSTKPVTGLHFSLQQQGDTVEYSYEFAASLIANAFFSTYPKRTSKTHPTLRDFNFTEFFKHLHKNGQKAKLRSLFYYFDFLETDRALDGNLTISRQVMTSKQWLTIEDWLESNVELCPLAIRHEGRLERTEFESRLFHVCFCSAKFGDGVLRDGVTQETVQIATHPEMLAAILSVEALEDNEVLVVEGVRHVARIHDPDNRATFEKIEEPGKVTLCCMDPENYSKLPLSQFEEDNILRELNKSVLGFRQRHLPSSPTEPVKSIVNLDASNPASRRLSPIGESFGSVSPEVEAEGRRSDMSRSSSSSLRNRKSHAEVRTKPNGRSLRSGSPSEPKQPPREDATAAGGRSNRQKRFIVLGSSGEVLPVTRKSLGQMSVYSSCSSSQSSESFHSARDTLEEGGDPDENEQQQKDQEVEDEDEDEEEHGKRYSSQLDTPERRGTFARRLRDALKRGDSLLSDTRVVTGTSWNSSSDSNYAVGISIAGSHVADADIKVKRGSGSRGFVLRDETVDEDFLNESLEAEQRWLGRFRQCQPTSFQRKESSTSSRYSFSTEYSSEFCSELEEVYEQLSKWLEEPDSSEQQQNRELDARDRAVVRFAGSLLKRALSETFAGVPVQEGEPQALLNSKGRNQRHKLALAVRSLSLELARHRNRRQQSVDPGVNQKEEEKEIEKEHQDLEKENFEDAATSYEDHPGVLGKQKQRRKLWAVTFTSEILQTLAEDETTLRLPVPELPDQIPREGNTPTLNGGLLPVVTGNWGCGKRSRGDPQLKLIVQWLSASLAGAPRLIYYTCGHVALSKLDTVSRVLMDRRWTVGDLAAATLRYALQRIEEPGHQRRGHVASSSSSSSCTLFEELIGVEKTNP